MKNNFKFLIILAILLAGCICVGSTFAADVSVDDVTGSVSDVAINDIDNDLSKKDVEINNLQAEEVGNFTELQKAVDAANGILTLNKNYKYVEGDPTSGIQIKKSLTIDGNGCTIDGSNRARAFNITADNVIIKNINFINTNISASAGAIYWRGANGVVRDCTFINTTSSDKAGAIYWNNGIKGNVSGCIFINTTAGSGGAIAWGDVNGSVRDCIFINTTALSNGGAIWWDSFVNGSVSNCTFTNTNAADRGGAIYSKGANGVVSGCIFDLCSAPNGNVIWTNTTLDFKGNFFTTNNTISAEEFIDNKFVYKSGYVAPEMFVVLNINVIDGGYVLKFVKNGTNDTVDMIEYWANVVTSAGSNIVPVGEEQELVDSDKVTISAYSLSGALLAEINKEVEIVLPEDPVFVVGAGENYTVVIKSGGESIGADYTVVLELVNGDNRKNYTLTTDDDGSVSLPIYLGYAKVYTFNIYFDAQGEYLANTASQDISVVPLNSSLITDYVDDKMDSTVYSGDYWTAKLVDNKGNAIVNTSVEVHFKKAGADEKVYKVKSDDNGNVKLQLNLGYTGDYIIYAKFKGTSKYASSESHNITVTINKADVKLVTNYTDNTLFTTPNSGEEFKVQLFTVNDKVVKGVKLKINFTNSKGDGNVYNVTVKDDGFAYLPLNLSYVGKYFATVFFEGDSNYNPSQDSSITSIIVEK